MLKICFKYLLINVILLVILIELKEKQLKFV